MNGKNIRFQHLKIKNQKDSKSEIKGEIVAVVDQSKDYTIKTSESEPMKFCPECNGMMVPTEDGDLRCNRCGYGFDGKRRHVSKPYYYYNHESKIEYATPFTEDQKRIIRILNDFDKLTFDCFCSYLGISNSEDKKEIIENLFSDRSEKYISTAIDHAIDRKVEIAKENQLKKNLRKLDDDVFNTIVSNLNISTSKTRDEQIDDMIENYYIYQVENAIDRAKKTTVRKERNKRLDHVEKRRADFKEELLGLDSRVLEQLFIKYAIYSNSMNIERKLDILVRNYSFKEIRKTYKKIKKEL